MKYYNNIIELIGNTPLVKLNNITKDVKPLVLAKIESFNPGGTIIEATSGNTGIGLALSAALKGYKTIFVMTDKASKEKGNYLKALGAEVVIQPITAKYGEPDHYVSVAKR